MMRTYNRGPCPVCGREIANAGAGKVSHLRMHVREGKLLEADDCNYAFRGDDLYPVTVRRFTDPATGIAVYTSRR